MLLPVWFWVFPTLFGLVTVLVVSGTCLYFRRRVESIIKDASSVVEFKDLKQRLDGEVEQCRRSLDEKRATLLKLEDEKRATLRKLESEHQRQSSLKKELADLSTQVAQEKIKLDEYRKEVEDPHTIVIPDRSQELDGLESETANREIKNELSSEGQLEFTNEDEIRPLVKSRRVRKHKPAAILA